MCTEVVFFKTDHGFQLQPFSVGVPWLHWKSKQLRFGFAFSSSNSVIPFMVAVVIQALWCSFARLRFWEAFPVLLFGLRGHEYYILLWWFGFRIFHGWLIIWSIWIAVRWLASIGPFSLLLALSVDQPWLCSWEVQRRPLVQMSAVKSLGAGSAIRSPCYTQRTSYCSCTLRMKAYVTEGFEGNGG